MDWLYHLAYIFIGFSAGYNTAAHVFKRRADRAAIERRLANWAG